LPSIEAVCVRFKITKELFKNLPLTYDYKGNLISLLEKDAKIDPLDVNEAKFEIKCASEESLIPFKEKHSKNFKRDRRIANEYGEEIITDIKIKPINGVIYKHNKNTIKGFPIANESQVTIKKYNDNIKALEKNNKSTLLPSLSSELIKADNSTEPASRNENEYFPLLINDSAVSSTADLKLINSKSSKSLMQNSSKKESIKALNMNLLGSAIKRQCIVLPAHKLNEKLKLRRYVNKRLHRLPQPALGLSFDPK